MAAYLSSTSTIDALLQYSCEGKGTRDYWNLEDILAEEEIVPTVISIDARGLKYLDNIETGNT